MQPSDYIWGKIAHMNGTVCTTADIENAVKDLFKEIGATSAPYLYPLPEGPFPAYICTSVNEVKCHGIPDNRTIDWSKDIVNVDISFEWRGQYYDTCQSWGSQLLSRKSRVLTRKVAKYVRASEFKVSPFDIGQYTAECAAKLNVTTLHEFGGHGIGTEIHMDPFIPSYAAGSKIPLIHTASSITVEPIITDGKVYAQTEIQIWMKE